MSRNRRFQAWNFDLATLSSWTNAVGSSVWPSASPRVTARVDRDGAMADHGTGFHMEGRLFRPVRDKIEALVLIERICRDLRKCFDPVPGDPAHVIANPLIDRNADAAVAWRRRTDLSAGLPEARLGEG
jgi:hypothetical protein